MSEDNDLGMPWAASGRNEAIQEVSDENVIGAAAYYTDESPPNVPQSLGHLQPFAVDAGPYRSKPLGLAFTKFGSKKRRPIFGNWGEEKGQGALLAARTVSQRIESGAPNEP